MRTLVLTMGLAWQAVSPQAVTHAKAGLEARQAGNLTQAVSEFKKVTELAPDFPAGFVNLGAALLESRDYAAAIVPLERALELDRKLTGAEQMLGYALLSAGYAAEAIPHLEKTQSQDALGIAQLKTGKLPEAIANLNAATVMKTLDAGIRFFHESPKFEVGHVVAMGWGTGANYVFQAARENKTLDGAITAGWNLKGNTAL